MKTKKIRGSKYYPDTNVKSAIIDLLAHTPGFVTYNYINEALGIKSAQARVWEINEETPVEVLRVSIQSNFFRGRPEVGVAI